MPATDTPPAARSDAAVAGHATGPRIAVFDNSHARELDGLYAPWSPRPVPAPRLLFFNRTLAGELGLDLAGLDEEALAQIFSGNRLPAGSAPLAQVYAGHQFGQFSPRLGDGRALLIGEVIDRHGRRRDLAFKGSGPTPFARGGDGLAAVGPMLREVLIGEALHALGIPTSRALAVVATGETVWRERPQPGAVLTRVAASHLRVGSFQYFAATGQHEALRRLADHAIARHDPALAGRCDRVLGLLQAVAQRQARLVAQWMHAGFIHGVMNTDNMAISGESIDFGPCAFLEAHDPRAVFSSIDTHGRYAYGNQPGIARWNLARLAEALLPLLAAESAGDHDAGSGPPDGAVLDAAVNDANTVLAGFASRYEDEWLAIARRRLGLTAQPGLDEDDRALARGWLRLLEAAGADHTLGWRALAEQALADSGLRPRDEDQTRPLPAQLGLEPALLADWMAHWRARLAAEPASLAEHAAAMAGASPWLIARNHRVEQALAAAEAGDLAPFGRLLAALRQPFTPDPAQADLARPAPRDFTAGYRTFCGT